MKRNVRYKAHIVNENELAPLKESQKVLIQVSLYNKDFDKEKWPLIVECISLKFGDNFHIKSCDLLYRHNIARREKLPMEAARKKSEEQGQEWWEMAKASLLQLKTNQGMKEREVKKKYYRGWNEDLKTAELETSISKLRELYEKNDQDNIYDGKTIYEAMKASVDDYFVRHKKENSHGHGLNENEVKQGSFEFFLEEAAAIKNWILAGYRYIVYTSNPTAILAWATSYHLKELKKENGKDYEFEWIKIRINRRTVKSEPKADVEVNHSCNSVQTVTQEISSHLPSVSENLVVLSKNDKEMLNVMLRMIDTAEKKLDFVKVFMGALTLKLESVSDSNSNPFENKSDVSKSSHIVFANGEKTENKYSYRDGKRECCGETVSLSMSG